MKRSRLQTAGYRRQPERRAPRRQRGIALITAVLIVALATILAVNVGFKGYLDQRRSGTLFALDQGFEVALGAEAWAADILQKDTQSGSKTDDFTEAWATPLPPIPIDGGEVAGQLEDMQGRFNLNSLVKLNNGVFEEDPAARARFENLLDILGLEKKWAKMLVDWIDTDVNPGFPDGAEDNVYTTLTPPYRPPNMPITRASELLALAGFGLERYQKLEPFVTALPLDAKVNLCTAAPEVLDGFLQGQRQFTLARDNLLELRKQRCFPTLEEFQANMSTAEKQALGTNVIAQTSSWFRATIWVTIGTTRFTLYSLLYRPTGSNLVRPYLRSFGSP